ncbi:RPA-interacting protein [Battus philenor]|uniref:RPA-interacting protein n=1 Tax=Battus philenor TaxID=42288 RepID=UPI0035D09A61
MNSPKTNSSPLYKNLKTKQKQSPIAIKEKLRKDYKDKVQSCRNILLNKFRGCVGENELRTTLTMIYKNTFNFSEFEDLDEEMDVLEIIKQELIEEEIQRWLEEYEKSQMHDVDWSTLEEENVICPVCQKTNFKYENGTVTCLCCDIKIKTQHTLLQIRKIIFDSIEKHSSNCNKEAQFTLVNEVNDQHIYLICADCMDMQLLL